MLFSCFCVIILLGDGIMLEKFNADIISSMKEKNAFRLTVLRMVKGAMQMEHINNKKEVNDELLIECVEKQIKLRNDSINEFKKASRDDLIKKNEEEIAILKEYLPEQLSIEEVESIIEEVFDRVKPTGMKEMGLIMKEVTPKVKGRFNMSEVSSIIKTKLNNL